MSSGGGFSRMFVELVDFTSTVGTVLIGVGAILFMYDTIKLEQEEVPNDGRSGGSCCNNCGANKEDDDH